MPEMGTAGRVSVEVFDLRGRRVKTVLDDVVPVGVHKAVWRGDDDQGREAAAGVYFCRVRTPGAERMLKMLLMK